MPPSAIFFVPANSLEASPAQEISHRLVMNYDAIPLPPWSLNHRLFRETPQGKTSGSAADPLNAGEKPKATSQRYLQVLSLSHTGSQTTIAVTAVPAIPQARSTLPSTPTPIPEAANGEPATLVSISGGSTSEEFIQLISSKFGPLWQQRHTSHISNGSAFETGGFRIRVGELKQGFGGGTQLVRGGICEIEMMRDDNDNSDGNIDATKSIIRGFWDGIGFKGAREVLDVPGMAQGDMNIRQWLEILRLRSQ